VDDLLPTHNTINHWIDAVYLKQRSLILERLQASPFRINWSFDLWTSPNNKAILGIVAHWLEGGTQSGDYIKRDTLFGMPEIRGVRIITICVDVCCGNNRST
jgi:hypothetical protein